MGSVAAKVLSALTAIFLARMFGPDLFGQYGIVQSTVLMFATYGSLRLGNTAVKHVAQYRLHQPIRAARILKLSLFVPAVTLGAISTGVLMLAPNIAVQLLGDSKLSTGLALGAFYLFFLTYGSILQQALAGFEDFESGAKIQVLRAFLACILCIPMGWMWGVSGALLGLVLSSALVLPNAMVRLRKNGAQDNFPAKVTFREAFTEIPVLWQFALPGFLVLAVMTGASWICRVILSRQSGFSELGLYEAAGQWTAIVYFLPTVLGRVFMPLLSASDGECHTTYRKAFNMQIETIVLITGPLTICLLGLIHWLAAVYGDGFVGVERIMPLLFGAGLLHALCQSFRIAYESKGRQWNSFFVYMVWAIVLVGGCLLLIPKLGAMGMAVSVLIADVILLTVSGIQIHFFLIPGVLSRHFGLMAGMLCLIGLACFAQYKLNAVWGPLVCLLASFVAAVPLYFRCARAGLFLTLFARLRQKLG